MSNQEFLRRKTGKFDKIDFSNSVIVQICRFGFTKIIDSIFFHFFLYRRRFQCLLLFWKSICPCHDWHLNQILFVMVCLLILWTTKLEDLKIPANQPCSKQLFSFYLMFYSNLDKYRFVGFHSIYFCNQWWLLMDWISFRIPKKTLLLYFSSVLCKHELFNSSTDVCTFIV